MLAFFRNIRRSLLREGKTVHYLKYAIGEIILIVAGILLALQLNTWKEQREEREKEKEILIALQADLFRALDELSQSANQYGIARTSIQTVLEHMESNLPYHDSIGSHFFKTTLYWGTSDLNNATYETLKSIGLELITNQDLRQRLPEIFEEHDRWIAEDENRYIDILIDAGWGVYRNRFYDYWDGTLTENGYQGEMVPLDYEVLKQDEEFKYFLRSQRNQMKWLIEEPNESTTALIHSTLYLVKEELDTFK